MKTMPQNDLMIHTYYDTHAMVLKTTVILHPSSQK